MPIMCPLLPGQPGELGRHPRVTNTASAECSVGEHRVPKELPKGTGCRGSGGGKRGVSGRPSEKRQDWKQALSYDRIWIGGEKGVQLG